MPRALITGGAGFIGSHLIERFQRSGYEVEVIDDLSTGRRENVPAGVPLHVADVGSAAAAELIRGGRFDVIAHLAAQMDVRKSVADPMFDATTNIVGTLNLLEAVRGLDAGVRPRFVFASTGGALYGETDVLPTPEHTPSNADSPYGIAKLTVENYMAYYGRVWGLAAVALRFGNVYGPRQNPHGEAGVIAIFCRRALDHLPVTVYGGGTQTRDYVYVGDVADAFFAAATREIPPAGPLDARAFNIGTGVGASVLDLVRLLEEITGAPLAVQHAPARPGEIERSQLDAGKAAQLLGWTAKVQLREGLATTTEWIAAHDGRAAIPERR